MTQRKTYSAKCGLAKILLTTTDSLVSENVIVFLAFSQNNLLYRCFALFIVPVFLLRSTVDKDE